ncbi:MAG: TRAM domain-containing protein [Candidatus Micrarchaeia archaeon]
MAEEEGPQEYNRGERRGGRMGGERHGPRRGGMGMKPDYFAPKPVKVGDEVELTIESIAGKGDGIARKDNFVIFVKGTKVGDKVKVKITEVKARFAIGEIIPQ